jgi:phosphoglycerate dehydrogenase-like enzyme
MHSNKEKLKVSLLLNKTNFERTFHPDDFYFLKTFANVLNEGLCPEAVDEDFMKEAIVGADACITCWGTPRLNKAVLDKAPDLKLIAHAAGTPRAIVTDEVWERGIRVFTAAPVIAVDVAETTLGAIITSLKCLRQYDGIMRAGMWVDDGSKVESQKAHMKRLNYRLTVGIVGASHVGKNLIRLLQPFGVVIKLYDPYISEFMASQLGVKKVSLEELMASSDVVTVHAPNIPQSYHMINKEMLALMKDSTLFVNTARAPIVDEDALIKELKSGRISAYLDVFGEEPLPKDNILYQLDNVMLSPHISGGHTVNGGYERGNYIIQQLYSYFAAGILRDEAVRNMMEVIA